MDVGGSGKDNTVFTVFRGWEVVKIDVKKGLTPKEVVLATLDMAKGYEVPMENVAVDAIGIGEGVAKDPLLNGCFPFKSSMKPIVEKVGQIPKYTSKGLRIEKGVQQTEYNNLRSQCGFGLASKIHSGDFAVRIDQNQKIEVKGEERLLKEVIEEELAVLKDMNAGNDEKKRVLISKSSVNGKQGIKQILGRSPDVVDTFIMRYVFDILQRYDNIVTRKAVPLQERGFYKKVRSKVKFR